MLFASCIQPYTTKLWRQKSTQVWLPWSISCTLLWCQTLSFSKSVLTGPESLADLSHHVFQPCFPFQSLIQNKSKVADLVNHWKFVQSGLVHLYPLNPSSIWCCKYTLQLLFEPYFGPYWSNTNPTLIVIKFTDNLTLSAKQFTTVLCIQVSHQGLHYFCTKNRSYKLKEIHIYLPHVNDCLTAVKLRNLDFLASWCTAVVHHNLSKWRVGYLIP